MPWLRVACAKTAELHLTFVMMRRWSQSILLLCLLLSSGFPVDASDGLSRTERREIRSAIRAFYTWYAKTDSAVRTFSIYNPRTEAAATTSVNWVALEAQHQFLRIHAPALGAGFYTWDTACLRETERLVLTYPEEDMGFDYDRFTKGEMNARRLASCLSRGLRWEIYSSGGRAYVTAYRPVRGTYPDFSFSWVLEKEETGWKIVEILGDNECRQ